MPRRPIHGRNAPPRRCLAGPPAFVLIVRRRRRSNGPRFQSSQTRLRHCRTSRRRRHACGWIGSEHAHLSEREQGASRLSAWKRCVRPGRLRRSASCSVARNPQTQSWWVTLSGVAVWRCGGVSGRYRRAADWALDEWLGWPQANGTSDGARGSRTEARSDPTECFHAEGDEPRAVGARCSSADGARSDAGRSRCAS